MSLPIARRIANAFAFADGAAEAVQGAVRQALGSSRELADAVDGTWLGAPLHAALTDVPVGALTTAAILDLLGRDAADEALAVGVAGAVPAAVTGLADWRYLRGEQRRLGFAHAVLNVGGLACHATSLAARRGRRRGLGRALLLAGYALNGTAAHLGGQLSFGLGVRVNRTAWESDPEEWVDVGADDLGPDELRRADAGGAPVLLARAGGRVCALSATCTHLGGPLDEGERHGDTVVCPWHGSRFDLCSGAVVDGPAVFPEPRYETRVRDGRIEVRAASG